MTSSMYVDYSEADVDTVPNQYFHMCTMYYV